jgi:hypothetical protein
VSGDENLPEPYKHRLPARPMAPPVHDPRTLGFAAGRGRHGWWDLIDEAVKRRIEEKVGPRIEWWAHSHATERERPYAVVLGPDGLAVTTPTMNNAGFRSQLLRVRHFAPGSMCYAIVQQEPSGGSDSRNQSGRAVKASSDTRLPLSKYMSGFLGNLPVEAQARLQGPFLGNDSMQDSDYYYCGSAEELDIWCYLAGKHTVTFASGHRVARADAPPRDATWHLICRMATVVPR